MAWLTSLPLAALYGVMSLFAAIENVFPPIPADTIVAFGSFLAAQGKGSVVAAFLAVWAGNVAGAAFTYALGRRLGAGYIERKFLGGEGNGAQQRLEKLYNRYGLGALFLSRFLPGVRAIVPPFAGALRVPAVRAMLVIGIASGIWYGAVAWLAFRLGADWERVAGIMARQSRVVGIVVAVLVAVVLAVWMLRRRGRHVRS